MLLPLRLCHSTVGKIVNKFNATGSVHDLPRSGRPSVLDNEEVVQDVLQAVEENWYTNLRAISVQVNLSRTSVWNILKEHKYRAYKAQSHQMLYEDDNIARLEFCNTFLDRVRDEELFGRKVLWTDESLFTVDGIFNKQNKR